jgi:catechol O-methyltransferase
MVGSLDDGGRTIASLDSAHHFGEGGLDFVFLDHDKDAYLHDLQRILDCQWLHPGSVVVADNALLPGAPQYRAYMQTQNGRLWHTTEHRTHLEYQSPKRSRARVAVPWRVRRWPRGLARAREWFAGDSPA